MASTVIVCEVQAMYVANSRALCHLHAFMRVSASLGAHDLWIAVIYFWFAKTLRRLHYQLLAPMSLMNLRHLGLTDRIDSIPPLRNRELEHLVIGVELERPARHLRHKDRHLRSRMSAGDKEIPALLGTQRGTGLTHPLTCPGSRTRGAVLLGFHQRS